MNNHRPPCATLICSPPRHLHVSRKGLVIALSGSPGSGKSTLANEAADKGFEVTSVRQLAEQFSRIGEEDAEDGARPIDISGLVADLEKEWAVRDSNDMLLLDGHLSHHLPVDAIVILRYPPEGLRQRNHARGWAENKVEENAEWELLGGTWNDEELFEGKPVLEIDVSEDDLGTGLDVLVAWIANDLKPERPAVAIDWIDRIHG